MREGKYWFNLMTVDEQTKWVSDWGPVEVGIMWSTFTKTYDNFEAFIRGTVKSQGYSVVGFFKVAKLGWEYETGIYWGGVINKYSGHDILLPTHRIKKHLL